MISSRQRRTRRAAGPQRTRGCCAVGPQAHVSVRVSVAPAPARMVLGPAQCWRSGAADTRRAGEREPLSTRWAPATW